MQSLSEKAFNPFERLENPDYIKERLEYFGRTKWKLSDMQKLESEYLKSIGFVGADYLIMKKGAMLYRACENEDDALFALPDGKDTSKLFQTVGRLGINSRERTTRFGRANLPHKPAFYACPDPMTAVHEVVQWTRRRKNLILLEQRLKDLRTGVVKPGTGEGEGFYGMDIMALTKDFSKIQVVTVSGWEVQEDIKLAYFLDKKLLTPELRKTIEWDWFNDPLLRIPGTYKVRKSIDLIRTFFASQFTKLDIESEEDYMLSALCADLVYRASGAILDGKPLGIGGILYSSVAQGFKGINVALAEDVVLKKKVKFVSAHLYTFNSLISRRTREWQSIIGGATCNSEETDMLTWKL